MRCVSPEPVRPRLKREDEFRIMGTSPGRLDVPRKVDGTATFGIDVTLPDMKYAAIRAAPVFGSRVARVDPASVQDRAGVRRVVDPGDAVTVVADGYWEAEQALAALDVTFTETGNEGVDQGDIFEQFSKALDRGRETDDFDTDLRRGDAAGAVASAERVVETEYRVPYLAHATMEPMNCTARVEGRRCELWLGTQNPLGFAKENADEPRFVAVLDLAARKADWDAPRPAGQGRGIAIHRSFGTIVAQVADVVVEDGRPRALRVVCAVDPGYAVHPDGLRCQMESGIAFGLTAALYGEISIRGGTVQQGNFHDDRMRARGGSLRAGRYLEQVIAELRLDGPLHGIEIRAEHDLVELLDHHPGTELAELAAATARGAVGMLFRQLCEVHALLDLFLELTALRFGVDENVSCRCLGHAALRLLRWRYYSANTSPLAAGCRDDGTNSSIGDLQGNGFGVCE